MSKKYLRWCRRSRRIEWYPSILPSFLAGQYLSSARHHPGPPASRGGSFPSLPISSDIQHTPGQENVVAGALSRPPAPQSPTDPVQQTSRIQSQQQKRGEKKIGCQIFFVATNFTKLKIIFEMLKKKILGQFSKNYSTF